jgi:hypothetical protein
MSKSAEEPVKSGATDDESEFERFEKFAGKIIRVPKREIDEQREQERKEA